MSSLYLAFPLQHPWSYIHPMTLITTAPGLPVSDSLHNFSISSSPYLGVFMLSTNRRVQYAYPWYFHNRINEQAQTSKAAIKEHSFLSVLMMPGIAHWSMTIHKSPTLMLLLRSQLQHVGKPELAAPHLGTEERQISCSSSDASSRQTGTTTESHNIDGDW